MTLSITMLCHYVECNYADCRAIFIIMLNDVMLSVVTLSVVMLIVVMLSVIMLSVVAPLNPQITTLVHFLLLIEIKSLGFQSLVLSQITTVCCG